jgi:hypothetical protein
MENKMINELNYRDVWKTLSSVNVNDRADKKMNLTYLSWAWAWGTLMEHYPFASYSFRSLGLSLGCRCIACTDAHGLAVGDPKRKLCGLDMDPTVSLDYRKRDGRWVPLESVSKL